MRNDLTDWKIEPPDEPEETDELCRWTETDDGDEVIGYTTECGRVYEFVNDTLAPAVCQFCLRDIVA